MYILVLFMMQKKKKTSRTKATIIVCSSMGRVAQKRKHKANGRAKSFKTKRYGRDLDQIHADLVYAATTQVAATASKLNGGVTNIMPDVDGIYARAKVDPEKPGLGLFYCMECSRYMENQNVLDKHKRSKPHKRRVKELVNTPPYTQAEADAAAGLGPDDSSARRKMAKIEHTVENLELSLN